MNSLKGRSVNQMDASSGANETVLREKLFPVALPALSWQVAAWMGLTVAAILTRFINIGLRVMSHDESMHVFFSWNLSKGGGYIHNPMMHGPLLYELTALFDKFFGATDATSRIVPALFGIFVVIGVPLLFRRWLGPVGALVTSALLLVSPYVLFYSRYNRHDIEEIGLVLVAVFAMLAYQQAVENDDGAGPARHDGLLLLLAGALALMFAVMETAFFYLAIFASFLLLRMLAENGLHWSRIRRSAQFDLLIVLSTLGAFFSSPIALLIINPIWSRITGQPFVPVSVFNTFGVEWASGETGLRIWGLLAFFWMLASIIGYLWGEIRWLKLAGLFLALTAALFTTFFSNKNGLGTGFVGSLGYWLAQQGVARGGQPWYYYFIVFPLYEYLPLLGGIIALIYFAFRQQMLSKPVRVFVLFAAWWAFWIFFGLSAAGEKMPWLSTHITIPFILLTGWLLGQLLRPRYNLAYEAREVSERTRFSAGRLLAVLPLALLFVITIRTSYLVNYVNYDYTTEFIDYAHGGPGVTWFVEDVAQISTKLGQGPTMPVPLDNASSWPLTWYLRNRTGFYADQPDKATLLKSPIVVAGAANWDKVEAMLGADYNRYEIARVWWPMEDYKNLTWDRIRGALIDPKMRLALWNIFWSRDYHLYAALTGQMDKYNPPKNWPLEDRMRIYIRKDVAAQIPHLALQASQMADLPVQPALTP